VKAQIRFMTSEEMHNLSNGEVLLSDTYNFRETPPSPVPTGLMCESIFGPVVDYRCACGAIDGKSNIGIRCHVCGVDIVSSTERAKRMGHITLPYPCIHPLAVKWLSRALGVSSIKLQSVMYGKSSIDFVSGVGNLVIDGEVGHLEITEGLPDTILDGTSFAISQFIDRLDLKATLECVDGERAKLLKRMHSGQQYIVKNILVIPPDYRPLLNLDGMWVTSAINQLYVDILHRTTRIERMRVYQPPSLIMIVELMELQKAIDRLFIDGLYKRGIQYKSLLMGLTKKEGLFRRNLLGKRVDFSGRSVITSGPDLHLDEVGIPIQMALRLFEPFIIHYFRERGFKYKTIRRMIKNGGLEVIDALEVICKDQRVILNRQPTLHKLGIRAFKIRLHAGKSIKIPSLVCGGYNADFDGDSFNGSINIKINNIKNRLINNKKTNIICHISDLETMEV
jgi:DNA-directed RNA polymerase beta' subunit